MANIMRIGGGVSDGGKCFIIKEGKLNTSINARQTSFTNKGNVSGTFQYEEALKALVCRKVGSAGQNYQPVIEYAFNNQNGYTKLCIELENEGAVSSGSLYLMFGYGTDLPNRYTISYHPLNGAGGGIHIAKEKMLVTSNINYLRLDLHHENRTGYLAVRNAWLEK